MTFFVFYYSLCLKVHFVQYKCFPLLSMHEISFPIPLLCLHVSLTSWSESLVGCRGGYFFLSIQPFCVFWWENLVHLHSKLLLIDMDFTIAIFNIVHWLFCNLFLYLLLSSFVIWWFLVVLGLDSFFFPCFLKTYYRFLLCGYHDT